MGGKGANYIGSMGGISPPLIPYGPEQGEAPLAACSHDQYTAPTLHLHCTYTVHTLHIHCTYTVHKLCLNSTYTGHTLHLHSTYTSHTHHLHYTYTAPKLPLHCTYNVYTLHLHCTYTNPHGTRVFKYHGSAKVQNLVDFAQSFEGFFLLMIREFTTKMYVYIENICVAMPQKKLNILADITIYHQSHSYQLKISTFRMSALHLHYIKPWH